MISFETWAREAALIEYQGKELEQIVKELGITEERWYMANSFYKCRVRNDRDTRELYESIAENFKPQSERLT